jgi:prepilin-type N-terminal cleavage/methylation domain-containing protein
LKVFDDLEDVSSKVFVLRRTNNEVSFAVDSEIIGSPVFYAVSFDRFLGNDAQFFDTPVVDPGDPGNKVKTDSLLKIYQNSKSLTITCFFLKFLSRRGFGTNLAVSNGGSLAEQTLMSCLPAKKHGFSSKSNYWKPVLTKRGNKICHLSCSNRPNFEDEKMRNSNNQKGFSLVELLLVVVIIGIIAAIGIPYLQKSVRAAENGATFAILRALSSTEINYFSQHQRFGRLDEIAGQIGYLGSEVSPTQYVRNNFTYVMVPVSPTDADLHDAYTIIATSNPNGDPVAYSYELTQTGEIRQLLP